jgi:hypothetical protein
MGADLCVSSYFLRGDVGVIWQEQRKGGERSDPGRFSPHCSHLIMAVDRIRYGGVRDTLCVLNGVGMVVCFVGVLVGFESH